MRFGQRITAIIASLAMLGCICLALILRGDFPRLSTEAWGFLGIMASGVFTLAGQFIGGESARRMAIDLPAAAAQYDVFG